MNFSLVPYGKAKVNRRFIFNFKRSVLACECMQFNAGSDPSFDFLAKKGQGRVCFYVSAWGTRMQGKYNSGKEVPSNDNIHWAFALFRFFILVLSNSQTCAIHLLARKGSNLAISLIHCMEVSHDPSSAGPAVSLEIIHSFSELKPFLFYILQCAKDVGVDFKPIETCASGKIGNELEHVMADRTENLRPKMDWVPWIVVNGVHTEEIQQKASSDLHSLVCSTYKVSHCFFHMIIRFRDTCCSFAGSEASRMQRMNFNFRKFSSACHFVTTST